MFLSVGEIKIRIKSNDLNFICNAQQEFADFLCLDAPKEYFVIEVENDYIPVSTELIEMKRQGDVFNLKAEEFKGWVNVADKTAKVSIADLDGVLNCFLRVFYSVILLDYNGFLLHSAGLAYDDRGFLFAGPSESGKTTAAAMAGECKVLSDELVLVREYDGEICVFATPFKGEYRGQINDLMVPLKSIAFLTRDMEEAAIQLDKKEMFLGLAANVFFFADDTKSSQRIMDIIKHVSDLKSGYRVNLFNNDIRRVIDEIGKEVYQKQSSCLAAG